MTQATVYSDHDHSECIARALQAVSEVCERRGLRLTPLRKQILEIIWRSHKPIGAYSIMHELADISFREQVAPPTVYRSLDFLLKHRLVHRVHSQNAFIGRRNPSAPGCEALLICTECGHAEEVPTRAIEQTINLSANERKFSVNEQVLEIIGCCRFCRAKKEKLLS